MKKIGLLGGTFDPVHYGHLRMAAECKEKLGLEEIWFIPAAKPPHKDWEISPYEKRRHWLEVALKGKDWCRISDIEQHREGKSYTFHTLKTLHKQEPDCEFYFLTGADSLEMLDTWHHWEELLDLCHFVATSRPGYGVGVPERIEKEANNRKGGIICLEIDALNISSTEIREQIVLQHDITQFVPAEIIDEVKDSMEIKVEGYKELLKKRLSPKRYVHSIGVANTSAKLAGKFNGNIERAYLAGLLHDYAREVSSSELLEITLEQQLSYDPIDVLQPNLLHGPVGAWMLQQQGIITDKAVLNAIRWHTTGHPDMDQLARIVYIADYIEPSREFPGVEALRQIAYRDLNLAMLAGLDHTISFLIQKGGYLHPLSVAVRNRLVEEREARHNN